MSSECIGLKLITTQQQQQPSRDRIVPIFRAGSRTTPWTSPMLCDCSPAKGRCAARQRCPERCWFGPKRNVQFPVSSASTSTALSFSTLASFEVEEALETTVVSVEVVVGD